MSLKLNSTAFWFCYFYIIAGYPPLSSLFIRGISYRRFTVEGLYCKRPIQCLASSEILTPHPPHRPASVYPLPLVWGKDTLLGEEGVGFNSSEDARHCSVLYICKYFVRFTIADMKILTFNLLNFDAVYLLLSWTMFSKQFLLWDSTPNNSTVLHIDNARACT